VGYKRLAALWGPCYGPAGFFSAGVQFKSVWAKIFDRVSEQTSQKATSKSWFVWTVTMRITRFVAQAELTTTTTTYHWDTESVVHRQIGLAASRHEETTRQPRECSEAEGGKAKVAEMRTIAFSWTGPDSLAGPARTMDGITIHSAYSRTRLNAPGCRHHWRRQKEVRMEKREARYYTKSNRGEWVIGHHSVQRRYEWCLSF
jgi:hypothetical protein